MQKNKISICTVCMNRLHHIEKTLLVNIKNNMDYDNIEFVLLDYGSSDGLYEWVKKNLITYIDKGILKYYHTALPQYFDRSHSRNLMFKLATGDIICNVDADNYTGSGFATYVTNIFSKNDKIYLAADTHKKYYFLRNAFGRFCLRKKDFEFVGGLDEKMKSYGSETLDFYGRLTLAGNSEVIIEDTSFLKTISHSDEERISNEFFIKNLKNIYINYISIEESQLIIFYEDYSFEKFNIIPEKTIAYLPAALKNESYIKGTWEQENNTYLLNKNSSTTFTVNNIEESGFLNNNTSQKFYKISDTGFILQIAKNFSFIVNTEQQEVNKLKQDFLANSGLFGKGVVEKNFHEEIIVS